MYFLRAMPRTTIFLVVLVVDISLAEGKFNHAQHLRHDGSIDTGAKSAASRQASSQAGQMQGAQHSAWQSLIDIKSNIFSEIALWHRSSSGTPADESTEQPPATVSYRLPPQVHKEVAGRLDYLSSYLRNPFWRRRHVRKEVAIFCCALVAAVYLLSYALLMKWRYAQSSGLKRRMSVSRIESGSSEPSGQIEVEQADPEAECATMPIAELIDAMGISAMCLLPKDHSDSAKVSPRIRVPLVFLQSTALQLGLLYYMWLQLTPRPNDAPLVPHTLTFIAIYVHFLNCVQELPYAIQIFRYFANFQNDIVDLWFFGFMLIADGFVTPLISFILGALYLCTSTTISEVILNSVAVAFVRDIDNWILQFNAKTSFLSGFVESDTLQIPISAHTMRILSLSVVYCPILPALCSAGSLWIGYSFLRL